MADAELGQAYLLQIEEDPTGSPDVFTTLAKVVTNDLNLEGEEVDVATKDDGTWSNTLAGELTWGIPGELIIDIGASTQDQLFVFFRNKTKFQAQILRSDGKVFRGPVRVTSMSQTMPKKDAAKTSLNLAGAGQPTKFWENP